MQICKIIFSYLDEYNIQLFLIFIYKRNIILNINIRKITIEIEIFLSFYLILVFTILNII